VRDVTPATDVYALGVVTYQCLAGRPPFLGDNPATVAMSHLRDNPPPLPGDVPAAVREVVETAMAKNPADRFPTAAAMAAAAAAPAGPDGAQTLAADGSTPAAGGVTVGGHAPRAVSRRRSDHPTPRRLLASTPSQRQRDAGVAPLRGRRSWPCWPRSASCWASPTRSASCRGRTNRRRRRDPSHPAARAAGAETGRQAAALPAAALAAPERLAVAPAARDPPAARHQGVADAWRRDHARRWNRTHR
jgi:serine/threonine-protein kinase